MKPLDYRKLWEDGGYSKDTILENTVAFLVKRAEGMGGIPQAAELAIADIFLKVAAGKKYSTTKCSCGCGIDKSGTDITHAMLAELVKIDREFKKDKITTYNKIVNANIVAYQRSSIFRKIARILTWNRYGKF